MAEGVSDGAGRPAYRPIFVGFGWGRSASWLFEITRRWRADDRICFHLSAMFEGETVGMDVSMFAGIKGAFAGNVRVTDDIPDADGSFPDGAFAQGEPALIAAHVYAEGVVFRRSGVESDRLLAITDRLWGCGLQPARMVDACAFTAVALHQTVDIETEILRLKLTLPGAETLLNVGFQDGTAMWQEQVPDFREALIKALMG